MSDVTLEHLTDAQLDTLAVYEKYIARDGRSPTMSDVAAARGVSKVTIFGHLRELVRKGYIEVTPNRARGVKVLHGSPDGLLAWATEAASLLVSTDVAARRRHAEKCPVACPAAEVRS